MTIYNVHIYREMKLLFEGIEAGSHEAAAAITRDKPTDEADSIDDCEGVTLSALVDVQGDGEYEHSRLIDFDDERMRRAAPAMLEALLQAQTALNTAPRFRVGDTDSYRIAVIVDKAIADAQFAEREPV